MQPRNIHILLVDDDEDAPILTQAMLDDIDTSEHTYELDWAPSYEKAVELILQQRHDVCLIDYRLGAHSGAELINETKSKGIDIPAIILTEYGAYDVDVEAMRAGAVDYWHKDQLTPDLLERSIRYAISRKNLERLEHDRIKLEEETHAMERVFGVIGHELRTPLTGIRAVSELLISNELSNGDERERFMASLHEEVIRMIDMVNNMLDAAKMDSREAHWRWTEFTLQNVCQSAIDLMKTTMNGSQIELTLCVSPPELAMRGDEDGVRRLVLNLVSNAIKFTKQGHVKTSVYEEVCDDARWIHLVVSDSGTGMSQDVMEKRGRAFALNSGVSGSGQSKGAGLGLAVCKGIAAVHGGSIQVKSEEGVGAEFTVKFRGDLESPADLPEDLHIIQETAS